MSAVRIEEDESLKNTIRGMIEEVAAEKKPSIEVLEIAVEEQRRVYDWLFNNYQQAKIKILAYIGGGLTALTFLYSSGDLFIPKQTYGRMFYFIGVALVIGSLVMLFIALRGAYWECPTEKEELRNIRYKTKAEYLEYVKSRYLTCYELNIRTCAFKHKILESSFLPLVSGVIILLVLNLFKENIR